MIKAIRKEDVAIIQRTKRDNPDFPEAFIEDIFDGLNEINSSDKTWISLSEYEPLDPDFLIEREDVIRDRS